MQWVKKLQEQFKLLQEKFRQWLKSRNIPELDFKPTERTKIKLFANTAEAIVFWMSLAGLIFLVIVSFFRFAYLSEANLKHEQFQARYDNLAQKIEELALENATLEKRVDSLQQELGAAKSQRE